MIQIPIYRYKDRDYGEVVQIRRPGGADYWETLNKWDLETFLEQEVSTQNA